MELKISENFMLISCDASLHTTAAVYAAAIHLNDNHNHNKAQCPIQRNWLQHASTSPPKPPASPNASVLLRRDQIPYEQVLKSSQYSFHPLHPPY